jgi:hypothetical protein
MIRNEKIDEGPFMLYRMYRGDYLVGVAVTKDELEVGRDVVAMKLREARKRLAYITRRLSR